MKKALSLIAALALSVSLLAGCGGNGGTETAAETTVTESTSVQESASAENAESEEVSSAAETAAAETASEETQSQTETAAGEETAVNVMALKGPTAMGMVQLMDTAEAGPVGGNSYEFTIAASADEVTPKLVQGDADIAAVPANLASVLYNNTEGQVQVLAINTLGVLYIVEKRRQHSVRFRSGGQNHLCQRQRLHA